MVTLLVTGSTVISSEDFRNHRWGKLNSSNLKDPNIFSSLLSPAVDSLQMIII